MAQARSLLLILLLLTNTFALAAETTRSLDAAMHHLRAGSTREWDEFPERAEGDSLSLTFELEKPAHELALLLRQRDVKQPWTITVNDRAVGQLVQDENDMVLAIALPADALRQGSNHLRIEPQQRDGTSDDIEVGQLVLHNRPLNGVLHEYTFNVEVLDADSKQPLPCRITLTTLDGSLAPLATEESERLAVRTGVVYTSDGRAQIHAPAGEYVLYAGRGFEYGLARTKIKLPGSTNSIQTLELRREVITEGFVACDTHIHTLTYSGHGDASIAERMVTLAGEGIELAIATDHNVHVSYEEIAQRLGVRQYFTPVIGNEVTTSVGHFNIFPVRAEARVPNADLKEWSQIFDEIYATPDVKISILNHARDLHSGVRPFGPKLHNWAVGQNLESWEMRFNGMEIINSGATQNDIMQLPLDWMALLNRGLPVTPVGSSDSHDVNRFIVGQGRTYIRCDDHDPGNISVSDAVQAFLDGRVIVSYGLFADLTVNERFGPGETVPASDEVEIAIRVQAPSWLEADHVALFANGQLIREEKIQLHNDGDNMWTGSWQMDRPAHDVHLVAIATGPGIEHGYWRTAKPYQQRGSDWTARLISCTGPVWLDADGDGRGTPAHLYASRIYAGGKPDLAKIVAALRCYDAAVAAHVVHQFINEFGQPSDAQERQWLAGSPATVNGYRNYLRAWRDCELARSE